MDLGRDRGTAAGGDVISGRLKVDLGTTREQRIPHLNSDPRRRTTAGRIINNGVRSFIRDLHDLAVAELKPGRPQSRRRSQGPAYEDSFVPLENHAPNIDRLEGGFKSVHPNALRLEYGTQEHVIPSSGKMLRFPWDGPSIHGGPRKPPGSWPVDFTDDNEHFSRGVNHPGTPAYHFVSRTRAKYRRAARGGGRPPLSSMK